MEKGVINWSNVVDSLVSIGYEEPFMFESAGTFEEKINCWGEIKDEYLEQFSK